MLLSYPHHVMTRMVTNLVSKKIMTTATAARWSSRSALLPTLSTRVASSFESYSSSTTRRFRSTKSSSPSSSSSSSSTKDRSSSSSSSSYPPNLLLSTSVSNATASGKNTASSLTRNRAVTKSPAALSAWAAARQKSFAAAALEEQEVDDDDDDHHDDDLQEKEESSSPSTTTDSSTDTSSDRTLISSSSSSSTDDNDDDDDDDDDDDLTTFNRSKSGTPSPWAVFDAWGGVADEDEIMMDEKNGSFLGAQPLDPALEAKLSSEAVQIPLHNNSEQTTTADAQLPSETEILHAYNQLLQKKSSVHFGYPYNLHFDYRELAPFMNYSINNLGDPFVPSNYGVHSRQFEVAVIEFFAKLWKLDDYWGYVTTSGTEGNLHGILLAREAFPDGILYTSQETHYSVFKAARYYRMPCQSIPTLPMGEVDYDALATAISQNKDKPVILNVNIGTTVKGAVDNLDRILRILQQLQIPRERFYIHCDGALFALMMPFIQYAPEVSFHKPIDSIAVSGHKFLGCPMPCGVTLSRKKHVQNLEQHIDYLNSVDTTIMGSRNGQAALYIWYSLRKKGLTGMQRDVRHCMDNARYLRDKLQEHGFTCRLNDLSTTVVLERPLDDALIKRWQLACEEDIAHVVVMPNVTTTKIDRFVQELAGCAADFGRIEPMRQDSPLTKLNTVW